MAVPEKASVSYGLTLGTGKVTQRTRFLALQVRTRVWRRWFAPFSFSHLFGGDCREQSESRGRGRAGDCRRLDGWNEPPTKVLRSLNTATKFKLFWLGKVAGSGAGSLPHTNLRPSFCRGYFSAVAGVPIAFVRTTGFVRHFSWLQAGRAGESGGALYDDGWGCYRADY